MQNNLLSSLKEQENKLITIWSELLAQKGATDGATEEEESKEFATLFLDALGQANDNKQSEEFEKVHDLLIGISTSRGKRGFSPRENAQYLITFKEAASQILSDIEKDVLDYMMQI